VTSSPAEDIGEEEEEDLWSALSHQMQVCRSSESIVRLHSVLSKMTSYKQAAKAG
jgi:hypothetical protein